MQDLCKSINNVFVTSLRANTPSRHCEPDNNQAKQSPQNAQHQQECAMRRLLRRFAPRNDGKKETRNDRKRRECAMKKRKVFCNQSSLLLQKIFKFFQGFDT